MDLFTHWSQRNKERYVKTRAIVVISSFHVLYHYRGAHVFLPHRAIRTKAPILTAKWKRRIDERPSPDHPSVPLRPPSVPLRPPPSTSVTLRLPPSPSVPLRPLPSPSIPFCLPPSPSVSLRPLPFPTVPFRPLPSRHSDVVRCVSEDI